MIVIPAIDIMDGKAVRLTEGDYRTQKVYDYDPLAVAQRFEATGFTHIHVVDLDGARIGSVVNLKTVEKIVSNTRLTVDFGGGLKTDDDVKAVFDVGVKQITGGSIAVSNPELFLGWVDRYGSDRIILGADARSGKVSVSGWQTETDLDVISFICEYHKLGLAYTIATEISKDGQLSGPDVPLYESISEACPLIHVVASGGVTTMDDLITLKNAGLYGAIVGKALYENRLSLEDALSVQNL